MSNTYYNQQTVVSTNAAFNAQVYGWMTLGIIITALVAFIIDFVTSRSTEFLYLFAILSLPAVIIQLVLVLVLSFLWQKLNGFVALALFLIYSAFTGLTVGIISINYSVGSIFLAFAVSALMFLVLSVYGLVTKQDLSRWRAVALFALVGIILVSIVNVVLFLLNSPLFNALSALVNYVIVVVFSVLIAADSANLKNLAHQAEASGRGYTRYAVSGALMLYLDFINLFLSVLRITGKGRN